LQVPGRVIGPLCFSSHRVVRHRFVLSSVGRLVLEDDVEGVYDSGDITEDCQEDVDAKVGSTAALEEDSEGWEDDGNDNLADVASGEGHFDGLCIWCLTVSCFFRIIQARKVVFR
jgi:hypothetical protein